MEDFPKDLPKDVLERHFAIESLREELEAVDVYDRRIAQTTDKELIRILEHNRDEEKEHAAMVIAWLAGVDTVFAEQLERFLPSVADKSDLGVGSLRERSAS